MALDQQFDDESTIEGGEMSFLEHLEELRWHILRSVLSIGVFASVAFAYRTFIFEDIVLAPKSPDFWTYRMMCKLADLTGYSDLCVHKLDFELQVLGLSDQFEVAPGLRNQFDVNSYLSVLATLSLGCAVIFQLPIVVFVLSKIGILTPSFMRIYRRHAWIIILVVAGIITPSPEIYSQILVAIPLVALYEISIFVSRRVERNRFKDSGIDHVIGLLFLLSRIGFLRILAGRHSYVRLRA